MERRLMKDYFASIEKLRTDAADAALVRDLATDPVKRHMYGRIYDHLMRLADEVELAMSKSRTVTASMGNDSQAGHSEPETNQRV
jgi:hypothetical protein